MNHFISNIPFLIVLVGICPGGIWHGGYCPAGICPGGICTGGICPGGICPDTIILGSDISSLFIIKTSDVASIY